MYKPLEIQTLDVTGFLPALYAVRLPMKGRKAKNTTKDLISKLVKAGDEHGKVARGIVVWVRLQFGIGWMVEWDTYRIGKEVLSTSSTMHGELRNLTGEELAEEKQKNLPNVYYEQVCMLSYQCLRNIYKQRRKHRHPDWQIFCDWVESLPEFENYIYPEIKNAK